MSPQPLNLAKVRAATADHGKIAELIKWPAAEWKNQCHAVSLAVLRSGVVGPGRIARGWTSGIAGQHSWIVLGDDCYDHNAVIVDPTYHATTGCPDGEPLILAEHASDLDHVPHGSGSIFADYFKPSSGGGPVIELTPSEPLSRLAQDFLAMLGPLDRRGWFQLANAPVRDWPAGEIFAAITDTPGLESAVPIDILGMTTDRNPGNLYR